MRQSRIGPPAAWTTNAATTTKSPFQTEMGSTMRRAAALNVAKALLLIGILVGLFGGLGWVIGRENTALLFVFCGLMAAAAAYWLGDRALLGMLGARPFALAEDPLLRSTTDRIAATLGVAPPRLFLIPDGYPRAFVVGRGPRGSSLAVSTGLLRALRPEEVEAVIAHELAHVRARDVLTQTLAVLLSATLVEASRVGGWLARALLFVLAPVGAAFTHLLLSPKRELAADTAASRACDPNDLADALLRLDRAGELVEFAASPATEPLYTVDPFDGSDRVARMFRTHPPLERRVERLRARGM
jgi:heat shock protein HtpX